MKNYRMSLTMSICAALVLLAAVTADAKEGFYLGLQVPVNKVGGDFDNKNLPSVDSGMGLGVIAGFGLTPGFSLELDWSGSGHKSGDVKIGFGEMSLNGKYAFHAPEDVQPFLFGGVGAFALGDSNLRYGGSGVNLGVGVDIYSSSNLSWGIALIKKFITYDEITKGERTALKENIEGDTTSLRLDVTYHF